MESVLSEALRREGKHHVHFHFFRNATMVPKKETNFPDHWPRRSPSIREHISGLDTSFRVTNTQNINPIIKDVCVALSRHFRLPTTCNMYVSPNSEFNCLGRHADIQESFIVQLLGRKRWFIYLDDEGRDLRRSHEAVDNLPQDIPHRQLTLEEGETLYTPSNLVHRVECDGATPSAHLNFAMGLTRRMDSCRHAFDTIKKEMKRAHNFNAPLNSRSLRSLLKGFQAAAASLDVERLACEYERKQFMESVRLAKEGRIY